MCDSSQLPGNALATPSAKQGSAAPGSRWRWTDNRWLALLLTAIGTTGSIAILASRMGTWALDQATRLTGKLFASIGLTPPPFFGAIPYAVTLLWFHPFALGLGGRRAALWIGLIGVGMAVGSALRSDEAGMVVLLVAPCFAMIGRRTRPWMAFPAAGIAIFTAFQLSATSMPVQYWLVLASLTYASVLIFGTKLIPKSPAVAPL
jgi:hypothetical protein